MVPLEESRAGDDSRQLQRRNRAAFDRMDRQGSKAGDVARELGMTVNAVYLASNRIRTRLRKEIAEFLDYANGATSVRRWWPTAYGSNYFLKVECANAIDD
jgi:hypothetical protein